MNTSGTPGLKAVSCSGNVTSCRNQKGSFAISAMTPSFPPSPVADAAILLASLSHSVSFCLFINVISSCIALHHEHNFTIKNEDTKLNLKLCESHSTILVPSTTCPENIQITASGNFQSKHHLYSLSLPH
jgi:hypothetical protein